MRGKAAFAVIITLGLVAATPSRAKAQSIVGRWTANVPEGTFYFHFEPNFANTPDGGLVGRFHHGEITQGGATFTRARGDYILRQFGPNNAVITLRFDDGHVVNINEHPVGGNVMRVQHNGRIEIYNRLL